jgi:ribosomal-protein-alanine N-acetyltransferase
LEAVKAISDFALKEMKIERIQATVAIDNLPSIKVLEKSGYNQECLMKKYGVLHSKTKDFYLYSLV